MEKFSTALPAMLKDGRDGRKDVSHWLHRNANFLMSVKKDGAAMIMSEKAAVFTSLTDEDRMLNDLHWADERVRLVVETHLKDKGVKSKETITPEVTSAIVAIW